jgi:ABC-2 type transport system permease protein
VTASVVTALIERDYRITRSYRLAFALDLVYGIVEVAVYFFISKTFAGVSSAKLSGAPSYFAFATVGIIVTLVIASASTGIAQRLREEQLAGTLEALAIQPVRTAELAFGWAGFACLFAFFRAATYVFFATVLFGLDLHGASIPGLFFVLLATAAAMLGIGIIVAAVTVLFKRGGTFASFAVFGMSILSGSVFPVSVLPGWLQPLGRILPTRFALDGTRHALFEGGHWVSDALALAAFGLVAIPLAVWLLDRALLVARTSGTIGQY